MEKVNENAIEGIVNYAPNADVTHYSLKTKRYYKQLGDHFYVWLDKYVEVINPDITQLVELESARTLYRQADQSRCS
ncbi:hypothetical protein [Enterovibrio norvegicus]|uniref:hypothetical protein n=1 Tax=Enterovibrio norvegicus TaxID=188144 RepID=UPI00352E9E5D